MKNVGFMRHLRQEWNKEKRATFGSTFIPFQSVELSLPGLLLSRAAVRFTQLDKDKLTADTVYFTLPEANMITSEPNMYTFATNMIKCEANMITSEPNMYTFVTNMIKFEPNMIMFVPDVTKSVANGMKSNANSLKRVFCEMD